jgi:serine/threonine protein phosphatase 1
MLSKWFRLGSAPAPFAPLAPDQPFTAIGDIHGRADLLGRLLDNPPDHQIICVGDYVDRGDDSADVLRLLHNRPDIICLSGNHEEMMLRFLEDPAIHGRRWLRFGGLQTLASFGIGTVTESSGANVMKVAAASLRDAMGESLLNWMLTMPNRWHSGNVAVVHAGADPAVAIHDQTVNDLHWGHENFEKIRRADDTWVVHGHTIVDTPTAQDGRIAIDTGAYATGRLTAAHIVDGTVSFQTL